MDELARREGDVVIITTPHNQYRFQFLDLVGAELQGALGYVIASAFVGADQNTGRVTMGVIKGAVRQVLERR